jgi:hypothetical protein
MIEIPEGVRVIKSPNVPPGTMLIMTMGEESPPVEWDAWPIGRRLEYAAAIGAAVLMSEDDQ